MASKERAIRSEVAARDNEAVKLRAQRYTLEHIRDALGYASTGHVQQQILAVYKRRMAELSASADVLIAEQLAEIDALAAACWAVLNRRHYVVNSGTVVRDVDDDGKEVRLEDDAPVLQATDRLARLLERKAKLLGIDKPTQVQTGLTVTIQGMDGEDSP